MLVTLLLGISLVQKVPLSMESKNLKNRLIRVITADNFNPKTCTFHTIRLNGGNENKKSKLYQQITIAKRKTEVRMLNKYPFANCGYVGRIGKMLHYEDLINARDENGCIKLQHYVVAVSSKCSIKVKTLVNFLLHHLINWSQKG